MQAHIEKQDHANETYMLENDKLRREIENIKAIEGNLRTVKQQLEDEKTIRVTQEFDITKLRLEIQDLTKSKNQDFNRKQQELKDLEYQNEENIRNWNLKVDELQLAAQKIDAQSQILDNKEEQINVLKAAIVTGEIKCRRLLDQLNTEVQNSAQENIDNTLNVLQRKFGGGDRVEKQKQSGFVSNADDRLTALMNFDRPKLTPELALKELEEKMRREQEEAGVTVGQTPAQILSQNLDYTRLSASGIHEVIA